MNKSPLLIVLFLLSFTINYAQTLDVGIKGGINYNNIGDFLSKGGSIGVGVPDENFVAESEIGFQYGIFTQINYKYFFIRPEVSFSTFKNSYPFPTKPAKWEAKQTDVPILLGYNIYGPICIFAGPVFSFISDMEMEGWEDTGYGNTEPFTFNKSSTSISVGILLDFGRVGVDFRYQHGLTTVEEQHLDMIKTYNGYGVNLGDLVEYEPSQFIINVQVNLFTINDDRRNKRSRSDWRNHKNL